jgi:putative hydrolase of the HAD superfamily
MIRAVFFDATGTLIHLPEGVGYHYQLVALRHGLELDAKQLDCDFKTAWRAMPQRKRIHGARPDDDKGCWRELVSRVVKDHRFDEFDLFFEDLYEYFTKPNVWQLYPDVRPVLDELSSSGYRLGIISNFDQRLRVILEQLRAIDYFEAIVLSSETGADKPDPAIFRAALNRLNVAPAEAVHAGDDPDHDWKGAAAAGLHVFQVERPHRTLRDLPTFLSSSAANA